MKIAIITAQSGSKGRIEDPTNGGFPNADYFAFVDKDLESKIWQSKPLHQFSSLGVFDHRRNAKLPKMLSWLLVPNYDFYIWHDSGCEVVVDPQTLVTTYLHSETDIALWQHPDRDCSYQECDAVLRYGMETVENLNITKTFLHEKHWPPNNGLFEMSSFIYRNSFKMQQALLSWWELVCRYSSRDQILWPFVVKTHNIKYNFLPGRAQIYAGNNCVIPQIRK